MSLLVSVPGAALAQQPRGGKFIRALDRMMVELAPQSRAASRAIRTAYRDHLDLLVLEEFDDLESALWNGGLAPLPHDTLRFNVAPRLEGASPIGEKDLEHQVNYIAARPATIGALLEVASRVKSGPVEVSSLVRHTEYQGALRATNRNATTSVPMHTMGLAFDIALVNTPLETVYEIRDALIEMRNAGEVLFIGERKQLVFHVVPHPSRLGHFHDVYAEALGFQPATDRAQVVALSRAGGAESSVTAEVIQVLPSDEFVDEWWAANHDHADVTVQVSPEPEAPSSTRPIAAGIPPAPTGVPLLLAAAALALAATCARMGRPAPVHVLLQQIR